MPILSADVTIVRMVERLPHAARAHVYADCMGRSLGAVRQMALKGAVVAVLSLPRGFDEAIRVAEFVIGRAASTAAGRYIARLCRTPAPIEEDCRSLVWNLIAVNPGIRAARDDGFTMRSARRDPCILPATGRLSGRSQPPSVSSPVPTSRGSPSGP